MTLTQLEYIIAVDKFRHFGKAATSCFVTQPTLSMQLQKLEEELGVILFDRSKNPILPTEEGKAIVNQAKIVIKENKKIFDVVNSSKGKVAGEFRLAVIPTLAPYLIPLFAKKFVANYPDIQLNIEEYKTDEIIRLLQDDEIDAGLLATPLHNDNIVERVLYYEPMYLFVDPKHPMSKKKTINQNDLNIDEIWMLNKGNCFRDQILNICNEKKVTNDGLRFESGNFETLKNMVLRYSGYTILPHLAVTQLSTERKKLIRDFQNPIPTREISLVHSRIFLKEKVIDALEKEIIQAIPKELKTLKSKNLDIIEIF